MGERVPEAKVEEEKAVVARRTLFHQSATVTTLTKILKLIFSTMMDIMICDRFSFKNYIRSSSFNFCCMSGNDKTNSSIDDFLSL